MNKKKIEIVPAILEKNFSQIEKLIKRAEKFVNIIQIDVCDGRLTPAKTFGSSGQEDSFRRLAKITKKINLALDFIVDMENGPKGRGDKFLKSMKIAKTKRAVFHFSGVENWDKIFQQTKNIEIGLGVWLTDDNKKVKKLLKKYPFKYIQLMSMEKVGYQRQKLSLKIYPKIKYFYKHFSKLPIQIDGGVKVHNAHKLKKAGAIRLISGSGFFGADDLKKRVKEFKKM